MEESTVIDASTSTNTKHLLIILGVTLALTALGIWLGDYREILRNGTSL